MLKKRLDEVSRKRVRAGRLLQKGKKPAEVALALGVARQTVYRWKALLDEGGIDALRDMAAPGRPARLEAWQLESLALALLKKPSAYGFETELWTLQARRRAHPSAVRREVRPDQYLADSASPGL